jgi:hypothetical protein
MMFSKKYEYRADNPAVRENIERIRQRMIANLGPALAQPGNVDEQSAKHEIADPGTPSPIALECQNYHSVDQNLETAIGACRQIAEDHRQADLRRGGLASLRKTVRRSLQWYTNPSERYWESLTEGLNHVVTSLKAHDAVLQIHASTVSGAQRKYSELVGQLRNVQARTSSSPLSVSKDDE